MRTGEIGKSAAERQTANAVDDIWWINEGKDYPHLWWELGDEASP
jgi:hypothetical protein